MRVALITGASRGLGAGLARHLALQGWRLVLAARDASGLDRTAREAPGKILTMAEDLTDPNAIPASPNESTMRSGVSILS